MDILSGDINPFTTTTVQCRYRMREARIRGYGRMSVRRTEMAPIGLFGCRSAFGLRDEVF